MTELLSKFDVTGRRESSVVRGIHYTTDEERQVYINDGYIPISDEDYQHYIGNRGAGDNGTGYIRDQQTGKPVSAPPAPPVETTEEPTANVPETELAVMEGMVDMQGRIAALEAELAKLKGGK
ncbi:hypothetical protein [Selenomonas sp. oral taxon 136]|uniref:hypothetical protein n=1 Tax=Selenomonas sp. oral taxon 136 TaxID=713030 RepID=UPI000767E312|nr:hypothetical protein [Selenomonas sp. oral taxon 136]AME03678.1 hypothetical protein AXE86_06110 [Selenomonas sp. oral taxon 136]